MTELTEVIPGSRKSEAATGLVRQTVEFLTVLSVTILLFRTFAAEAYIVPTGSMAPTLLGNHREVACPNCSYWFSLGQDDEERTGRPVCPNCGQSDLDNAPSVACSGDRVLVQKFLYDFRPPKRWEVAVFHFPNEPSQAYVKRVVGLPGDEVRIVGGDVEINGKIARKTLKEQQAMRVLGRRRVRWRMGGRRRVHHGGLQPRPRGAAGVALTLAQCACRARGTNATRVRGKCPAPGAYSTTIE